ncbi:MULTISPECIES: exopolysaccharide biosynthesis protein [unclassified Yoonia]|uniref:exopolysaccharide biosynthesis protein n=1 Tax=unclassified Yoonia TaxID=2629118 RepID=UPI002AFEE6F0|nr:MULTISPECIES: exopolysaccharide biosynthesis protein [unclassified Yoonia]
MTDHNLLDQRDSRKISTIVASLRDIGDADAVSVRQIVKQLGGDSFGPMMLVPALIVATPASGIPGLSGAGGLIIALVAIQMVLRRDHVWLPSFLMERRIARTKFERAIDFVQRPVGWIDAVTGKRLTWLLRWPLILPLQLLCVVLGLAMPVLEFLPFTSSIAATAVVIVAVAIVADDGLVALVGIAVATAGAAIVSGLVTTIF